VSQVLDPKEKKKFQETKNKTIRSSTVCNSPIWAGHLTRKENIRNTVNTLQTKLWFENEKGYYHPSSPRVTRNWSSKHECLDSITILGDPMAYCSEHEHGRLVHVKRETFLIK